LYWLIKKEKYYILNKQEFIIRLLEVINRVFQKKIISVQPKYNNLILGG